MKATGSDARFSKTIFLILVVCVFAAPRVSAQVVINEIMYDLPGTDTAREWVEIENTGGSTVAIATSTWKFFEANTNHSLSLFQGSLSIPGGGFAVIVDDPNKFLVDWPGFTGTIFDSSFSLSNTGETIALKSSTTTIVDQVTYSSASGAAGDGNSLQKVSGVWKALQPTPGLANPGATGGSATSSNQTSGSSSSSATTTASDDGAAHNNSSTEDTAPAAGSSGSSWPVEPQMFSRIIGPASAVAGADIVFKGEAVGLDKQPITNTRYLWNLGDGATKEGEAVLHAYNFPAEYVVILDASSGTFSGTARWKIKVIPANVVIREVIEGVDGKVELVNNSNQELDLSWWRIESGNQFFTLPKNTKILPRGSLPLSATVLGFSVDGRNLVLLYPNGVPEYRFEKEPTPIAIQAAASSPVALRSAVSEDAVSPPVVSTPNQPPAVSKAPLVVDAASQVAAVAEAVPATVENKPPVGAAETPHSPFWLYTVGGVIILGLGFTLLPKPKPAAPQSPADEFTVLED